MKEAVSATRATQSELDWVMAVAGVTQKAVAGQLYWMAVRLLVVVAAQSLVVAAQPAVAL